MQATSTGSRVLILADDSDANLIGSAVFSVRSEAKLLRLSAAANPAHVIANLKQSLIPTCICISQSACNASTTSMIREIQKEFPFIPVLLLGEIPTSGLAGATGLISVPDQPANPAKISIALVESFAWSERYLRLLEQSERFKLLNDRERAIVTLAADGVPNKAVASRLGVSIKTIEKNRRTAYEKLNVTSTATMATLVAFRQFCFPAATMTDLESAPRQQVTAQ